MPNDSAKLEKKNETAKKKGKKIVSPIYLFVCSSQANPM